MAAIHKPATAMQWVRLVGGTFLMGSAAGEPDEMPIRRVQVSAFELTQTEVTVAQYRACVIAGYCDTPIDQRTCNWWLTDRENHPINCVNWRQANTFAVWAGARLPSEAEWEFAARSGGRAQAYPWGHAPPTCAHAVMNKGEEPTCGSGATTEPVCSRPRGNSAQGLCDLAGNVWEWVADGYARYPVTSTDGAARINEVKHRVFRGGSWHYGPALARAARRGRQRPESRFIDLGFRVARDSNTPPPLESLLPERLSRAQIMGVINQHGASIRTCGPLPDAKALAVDMLIVASGAVTEVKALGAAAETAPGRCTEEKVRAFRFPPFAGEPMRIKMPFQM